VGYYNPAEYDQYVPTVDELEAKLRAFLTRFDLEQEKIDNGEWHWLARNIPREHKDFRKAHQLIVQFIATRNKGLSMRVYPLEGKK